MKMLAVMLALAASLSAAAAEPPVVHHEVTVRFDLATHAVSVEDALLVPAGCDSFALAAGLSITSWSSGGRDLDLDDLETSSGPDSSLGEPRTYALEMAEGVEEDEDGRARVTISCRGAVHQDAAAMQFSRENVANEITGTVGDDGIYLSGDLPWLPSFDGALNTYDVTVITPPGWLPVTNGTVVSETEQDGMLHTVFSAPEPADGITLIAQKYQRYAATAGEGGRVKAEVYLLEPDDDLRDTYLERTQAYVAMYEDMFGPYPYAKFATVENWFPSGYGMPGWTLLGGQVMRLPFIPTTSFGHEIAHSWWGNGVMVDPVEGNWCEGLTVWCADYRYKEQESAAAARDYRRTLLKDYAAYVGTDPTRDFPLTEFKSRHSGATRAVGYGKSMMIWHMLDRALGRDRLLAGLRDVYARKRFQPAAWSDFFAALGGDLDAFREQWLTRTGAPVLHLDDARRDGDRVRLTLWQESPPYRLEVPVVATTPRGEVREVVRLDGLKQEVVLTAPGATRVAVDPDYDVFRRLHPQEIEPTLSQVLAEEAPLVVLPPDPAQAAAGRGFAASFTESDAPAVVTALPADVDLAGASPAVVLNPAPEVLARLAPPELQLAGDLVFLEGKRYSLKEYDLVFATRDPDHPSITDLVVISRSPDRLPRFGERLGHYGKYSWLLLPAASGQAVRGNWPAAGNPLAAEIAG